MVAISPTSRLTRLARLPSGDMAIATIGAALTATLAGLACLVMPARLLEGVVVHSGIAALVNAAAPPLGITARLLLAVGSGVLTAAVAWAVLVLVVGERRIGVVRSAWRRPDLTRMVHGATSAGKKIRRVDAYPDAPPRSPILAERELGVPFLSIVAPAAFSGVPVIIEAPVSDARPLPDLDTPLAAVDPAAIPDVPREPVPTVASMTILPPVRRPLPPGPRERIDSVPPGTDGRDRSDSIEALLSRLERGTRRRLVVAEPALVHDPAPLPAPPQITPAASTQAGSLEETLGQLRRLATRG